MGSEISRVNDLFFLAGKWEGEGTAEYTTIKPAKYFDEITFWLYDEFIFYIQKTCYNEDGKKAGTLHIESGFIKITNDGFCELSNSQNNGRTEVLRLENAQTQNDVKNLIFVSKYFGNDPRMIKSRREITVEGNILSYEMKMAVTAEKELKTHLVSSLRKVE